MYIRHSISFLSYIVPTYCRSLRKQLAWWMFGIYNNIKSPQAEDRWILYMPYAVNKLKRTEEGVMQWRNYVDPTGPRARFVNGVSRRGLFFTQHKSKGSTFRHRVKTDWNLLRKFYLTLFCQVDTPTLTKYVTKGAGPPQISQYGRARAPMVAGPRSIAVATTRRYIIITPLAVDVWRLSVK